MVVDAINDLLSSPPVKTAAQLLFERLPDRLFAPLASLNRHRHWSLLCAFYQARFGPDAPLPPSIGFSLRNITSFIENELRCDISWEDDGDAPAETPIGIRAIGILNLLTESGWLSVEKRGIERRVTMKPVVSQFLTQLVDFAETGPVFVAGKVRSIDINLQAVIAGTGQGDTLAEAAAQARALLEHIRNTGMNVRDLMSQLTPEISTAQYVQRFFSDYIERVFIGDYRELKTKDHPLSRRSQILGMISVIHDTEPYRGRMLAWYETKRCPGNPERAMRLFERDISKLFELQRIDEYLDRLDSEIRTANRRALASLDYRLRSLRPVDHLVSDAIANVLARPLASFANPFAPGELMAEPRIAEPRNAADRRPPASLRRVVPSDEEVARSVIMRKARDARLIMPMRILSYARDQLGAGLAKNDRELDLARVQDVRAYQALQAAAMAQSMGRPASVAALLKSRGIVLQREGKQEVSDGPISGIPFRIARKEAVESTAVPAGQKRDLT